MADLRALLRVATSKDHARLDVLAARLDLEGPTDYVAFLCWHARVLPGLETRLSIEPEILDWPERSRTSALLADLAALGVSTPPLSPLPPLTSKAERIGALYVLEGSRQGAAMLARHVGLAQPDAPCSFLMHGAGTRLWPRFLAWLEVLCVTESEVAGMVMGARATFAAYSEAFGGGSHPPL